jgi:hypothetical protein
MASSGVRADDAQVAGTCFEGESDRDGVQLVHRDAIKLFATQMKGLRCEETLVLDGEV